MTDKSSLLQQPSFRRLAGRASYGDTVAAMQTHAAAIRDGSADEEVWLVEHDPVLTGGTSANAADLINPGGIPVHETGRGGQWTYHGPGQRVAYVMLDLQRRQPDVRAYVYALEGWLIDCWRNLALAGNGEMGCRGYGWRHPGVRIEPQAIAAWTRLPLLACGFRAG